MIENFLKKLQIQIRNGLIQFEKSKRLKWRFSTTQHNGHVNDFKNIFYGNIFLIDCQNQFRLNLNAMHYSEFHYLTSKLYKIKSIFLECCVTLCDFHSRG